MSVFENIQGVKFHISNGACYEMPKLKQSSVFLRVSQAKRRKQNQREDPTEK